MPLPSAGVLSDLCRVIARPHHRVPGDRELLQRFIGTRGEADFAALVARHGPLVWQVCRRLLRHEQDAEDAFQATFLVLAEQAGRVRKQASVKSWLYGAATRIALSLRRGDRRRRAREQGAESRTVEEPANAAALAELQAILAEEVSGLPDNLRAPIVRCCLEGHSKPEAAHQLGWCEGTLSSRLARAKVVLRARLAKRGVALSAALAVAALSPPASAVPVRLVVAVWRTVSDPVAAGARITLAARAVQTGLIAGSPLRWFVVLTALVLIVGAGWSHWGEQQSSQEPDAAQPADEKPRDMPGNALPAGAVARMGTDNLRAQVESLQFGADTKTLVGIDGTLVRTWDAVDGKLLSTRLLPARGDRRWAPSFRSRDGNTWLLRGEAGAVEVWDVPSGKRVDLPMPAKLKRVDRFAISDDRRLLLLCDTVREQTVSPNFGNSFYTGLKQDQTLLLWNTETKQATILAEKLTGVAALAIAPDGKRIAASGSMGTHVWDAATGKALWHEAKFNAEELRFTSDSRILVAAPGGGQNQWHLWDAATGKPAPGLAAPTIGYVWTFALSADDRLLAAPTATDYVVWDLKAGKVTHRWPCANQVGKILFAPDGRSVVLHSATLQRFDLASGKRLYADVGTLGHTGPVQRLAFTPDGSRLVTTGADETLRIWDPRSAKLLHTVALPPASLDAWALTPDGKTLLAADDKLGLHRWSLIDGKALPVLQLKEAQALNIRLRVMQMQVCADGKKLAVIAWAPNALYEHRKYSFSFWDVATGRLLEWGNDPGRDFNGEFARLAPDGRHAAWYAVLYATTFAQRRPLEGSRDDLYGSSRFTFSDDSRFLAGEMKTSRRADGTTPKDGSPVHLGLFLWEKATVARVKELARDGAAPDSGCGIVLSADGRWLGQVDVDSFAIHDLRTRKVALRQSRPADFGYRRGNWLLSASLAFAPDGRSVVTAHPDGNMLVWPLPSSGAGSDRPAPSEQEAELLWKALAGEPKDAYAAQWRLRDHPEQTLKLLRRRLTPVKSAPAGEVQALIRDLGSDDFEARSTAMAALRKVGRPATRTVRHALKADVALEVKRRLEVLLAEWAVSTPPTQEDVRHIRAVTVLEHLRTPEAHQLLEELSGGAPEARLTQEAEDALLRMLRKR